MFNDWDKLLYLIQQGDCVLFVGPELPTSEQDGLPASLTDDLTRRIVERLAADPQGLPPGAAPPSLPEAAQRLLHAEDGGEIALEMVVKRWHADLDGRRSTIHELLGELPIRVIVSGGYDPLMEHALRRAGKRPQVRTYNHRGEFRELGPEPSRDEPLLFHLFGHVSEPESLVLTETYLLEFVTNLISRTPALPNDVNRLLADGRSFLFLGFGLRHWYLRILLHYLKILKRVDRQRNRGFAVAIEGLAGEPVHGGQGVLFYQSNYKFDVLELDALDFVRELHGRYVPESKKNGEPERDLSSTRRPDAPVVFICHASEDAEAARRVHAALEAAQLNPWLDREALRGGERWADRIEETIDAVDYVVILHSRALVAKAADRHYVNKEIKLALATEEWHGLGRFIIPARLDDAAVDPRLKKLHFVDLTGPDGEKALVRAIKRER